MTTNLPKGFVTNSESITGDIERIDTVDVEEIFQLWRVYTTNKNVLQNDVGLRLENLFWRIWGNDQIRGRIKGSTVARLFIHISGAQTSKQNTLAQPPPRGPSDTQPTKSPRTPQLSLLSPLQRNSSPRLDRRYGQLSSQASREVLPVPLAQQPLSPPPERPRAALPHPILKKPHGGQQGATLVTQSALQEESGSSSASLAIDTAPRPPTPPKSRKEPIGSKRKRAPFVAATSANNRRKPALVLRKPSQSSAANIISSPSPSGQDGHVGGAKELTASQTTVVPELRTRGSHLSPQNSGIGTDSKGGRIHPTLELEPTGISGHTRHDPKPKERSSARRNNADSGKVTPGASVGGEDPKADWLVERDFRSKFVDKKRQEKFSFLLGHTATSKTGPTLAQSSMEATATIELGDTSTAKVLTKGKKVIVVDDVVPLKTEGLFPHRMLGMNDEPLAPLPRTKSQLTFLLERDRAVKAQEKPQNRKGST
ncbi:MAG: hypothetical protein M1839_006633 [Geoglossum umbratile]|nr:MAG: hypothetical protein M1839_006633 [Geoglossum umbratile]